MAKPAKRGRGKKPRHKGKGEAAPPRHPLQIVLERIRQGCYGICAGSIVAIPAALLSEQMPSLRMIIALGGIGLFAGTAGVMIEVFEHRIYPGGERVG
jgi:hypothetical protein